MIWQLHHQFKDGTTEFKSQREGWGLDSNEKIQMWIKETADKYPLPKSAKWLMCNEQSEYFMWMKDKEEVDEG